MGRNIESFPTYALLTDKMVMTGPDVFINDSNDYQRYTFFDAWSLKKDMQATALIKDYIELDKVSRARFVNAATRWEVRGRDGMTEHQIGWATLGNYLTYEDDEIEMNEADRRAMYKRLYKQKVVQMHTDTADMLEAAMWANPDAKMEVVGSDDVRVPYSIPALITRGGDVAVAMSSAGVTTKFNVNPSTKTGFKNYSSTFSNFSEQIELRLFRAKEYTNFQPPKGAATGSFTGTPLDRRVIYCDFRSLEELRTILRNSNDRLTALGQYDGKMTYDGVPIVWAVPLGGVDIDPFQQRLFGVNYDFLYPICRNGKFMKLMMAPYGGAFKPHDMPTANIIYEFTDYNWWARSMRRQFCIYHESFNGTW